MKVIDNGKFIELKADEGKILVSKTYFIDDETGEKVYDVMAYDVCLGIYDSVDNYEEIDDINEIVTEE